MAPDPDHDISPALRRLTELLETRYRVPLFGWRFGGDAILGLLPIVGDFIGAIIGAALVVEGYRLGVGWTVLGRMLVNLAVDAAIGSVPVVGDLADFAFRANLRNLRLLEGAAGRD